MRPTYAMLLAAATGALSCSLGNEGPRRMLTGVLEFTTAQALQSIPAPYLVAMDSLHIEVESGGGSDRQFDGRRLLPMDTLITATTRAREGPITVTARVLNSRRDTLFAGTTTGTVSGDDFRLTLTLVPLRPVLAVSPGQLTFSRNSDDVPFVDKLTIYNRGDSLLVWRANFNACSRPACFLPTDSGRIQRNGSQIIDLETIFPGPTSGTLIVAARRDSLIIPFQVP